MHHNASSPRPLTLHHPIPFTLLYLSFYPLSLPHHLIPFLLLLTIPSHSLTFAPPPLPQPSSKSDKYTLIHAPAEDAPVESNSQDLVSLCLVAHESPKWVSTHLMRGLLVRDMSLCFMTPSSSHSLFYRTLPLLLTFHVLLSFAYISTCL